ncbi:MAG: hypothetical protein IAE97_09870 [Chthoniobacterales bacterium]|nr:hypothetical protein [Chthoniobacterales bacterium]
MFKPLPEPLGTRLRRLIIGAALFSVLSTASAITLWMQGAHGLLRHMDIPLHLLGGFAAAAVFAWILPSILSPEILHALPKPVAMVPILGFTALVTIAWEVFEYFLDHFLGTLLQLSTFDTLKDMMVGLAGGALVAFAWPGRNRWKDSRPPA